MMSLHKAVSALRSPITRFSASGSLFSGSSFRSSALRKMSCASEDTRKHCILPNDTPVVLLDCFNAFEALNGQERRYAHHIAKASFDGALSVFLQVSPESGGLFILFYHLFKAEDLEKLKEKAINQVGWKDADWNAFLVYVAAFYVNSGNYKSFGDSKIIPGVSAKLIGKLLRISAAAIANPRLMDIWKMVEGRIDSLTTCQLQLGFGCEGVTCYHSENVTKEDTDFIDRFFKSQNLESWNSRLMKDFEKRDGKTVYRVKLASARNGTPKEYEFEGAVIIVERGDYAPLMDRIVDNLKKAIGAASNHNQTNMLQKYIDHFESGNIVDHQDGSRFWIKDKSPAVESYIGFIENYRDPAGTRSEFEGFVACVNKETSKKFQRLVEQAESILKRLPWGESYEKDKFLTPDFTALDVLAFAGSGIPSGINIPNYDSIRQDEGFKNVSLANVISATPKQKMNFLSDEDEEMMHLYYKESFEVQVGLHELLGHGSGKLFRRNEDGTFNFDKENTLDLITNEPVKSWYEPGESWSSKFGALSGAYEECRAEAVGYFLSCDEDILEIFGYTGDLAQKVKYVNWLNEMRAGLLSLEFYQPEQQKWGQAHSYARYVLTRVCLEAGKGFITIEEVSGEDGEPDLRFEVDKTLIDSVGKPAISNFLVKLQQYKSTGDFAGGKAMFESYGTVTGEALRWRRICLERKKPRRLFVQSNTNLKDDGEVDLISYPSAPAGVIQSFVERYDDTAIADLEKCWKADQKYFPSAYPKTA